MQFKRTPKLNQTRLEQSNFLRIYLCCILFCVIVAPLLLFSSAFRDNSQKQYIKTLGVHVFNTYIKLPEWLRPSWCYKLAEIVNVRVLSLRLSPTGAASAEHAKVGKANDRMVLASRLTHSAPHCPCWGNVWGAICILTFLFTACSFLLNKCTAGCWLALLKWDLPKWLWRSKAHPSHSKVMLKWKRTDVLVWNSITIFQTVMQMLMQMSELKLKNSQS